MEERRCYKCGATDKDLRPYGENGQDVCFSCAMGTPEDQRIAEQQFGVQFRAAGPQALVGLNIGPVPASEKLLNAVMED